MTLAEASLADVGLLAEDRAQAIRDRLRDAIVDRRLAPGAKLVEAEVGTLFDVSRTIARSAFQMLAFEGLVRIERNRGAFVANPSPEEARQVFAARRLLEPGVAETACLVAGPRDIAGLRTHIDGQRACLNARGASARRAEIKASGEFHLKLALIAGNAILARFMEELIARSSLVIALYGRSGASSCGIDEHALIVDALERGDVTAARHQIVHHLEHIEADLDLRSTSGLGLREALSF